MEETFYNSLTEFIDISVNIPFDFKIITKRYITCLRYMGLPPGPKVIKLFSCSAELSMIFFNVYKYKNIKKTCIFQAHINLECYLSCL